MQYTTFISYRHTPQSRAHAEALERALKGYARPLLKPPIKIFRDERVFRPGDDLPSGIRKGLETSEYLIYLASPEAAASEWIQDELRIWCEELGRADRLLIVHIGGSIAADPATGAVVWEETDALPDLLRPYVAGIPIWADLQWAASAEQRDLHNLRYREIVNSIVARFRNLKPGAMNDEEVLTHRRNLRLRNFALATIAALGIAAGIAWYIAATNADQLATSLSYSDFRQAELAVQVDRLDEALALLSRAVVNDPDNRAAGDRLVHLLGTRELPVPSVAAEPGEVSWIDLRSSPNAGFASPFRPREASASSNPRPPASGGTSSTSRSSRRGLVTDMRSRPPGTAGCCTWIWRRVRC